MTDGQRDEDERDEDPRDEDRRNSGPAWDEADRLAALDSYAIMDTAPERELDDIVRIAAQICGTPMALISLVDDRRQWFKSALGLDATETPRGIAFCHHAIQGKGTFTVEDATRDPRFLANPLVTGEPNLRFYAGAPLETPEGLPLGTLCVLDRTPRALTEDQQFALDALARQVMTQLELRRTAIEQRSSEARHRRILESAIDYGIVTMDLTGLVTSWNEGARRILGWTEAEMCGRPCDDFFTPEDRERGVPEQEMGRALAHHRASDERWHLRKDQTRFWASGEMMPLLDEADRPVGFLKILRDRTDFRIAQETLRATEEAAERDRRLLTGELEHRVKNTLAIVQAIVSQTLRGDATPQQARVKIEERLVSLGRAHDILTSTNWAAAPISSIVAAATRVHGSAPGRIRAEGPELAVQARAAVGLSMALHELSTNAAKYGALSNEGGRVEIVWTVLGEGADAVFELSWTETGGPPVTAPTRKGFGSRLIRASLGGNTDGSSSIDYEPAGVRWTTRSRLSAIQEL